MAVGVSQCATIGNWKRKLGVGVRGECQAGTQFRTPHSKLPNHSACRPPQPLLTDQKSLVPHVLESMRLDGLRLDNQPPVTQVEMAIGTS